MAYINENNLLVEGINSIFHFINKIINIFTENKSEVTTVSQMSIIHKQTESILNSLEEIFMILGENPEMDYEFVYCDDILLMASYIFNNDELIKKHTKFITEIIVKFCNLLNYKLECISSKKNDYDKKLEEFRFYIANKRTTFYTQIDTQKIDSDASEVVDFMIQSLE